jgi:hypothetical protein
MSPQFLVAAVTISLVQSVAFGADEKYGPFNVDGGHITCKSFSGDEIKKSQVFNAPDDRFFEEGSIKVITISGNAPKKNGCDLTDIRKQQIQVKTDYGTIPVSVIKGFTVYAYADCGTDGSKFLGKTASIECEASATMVKYTNK